MDKTYDSAVMPESVRLTLAAAAKDLESDSPDAYSAFRTMKYQVINECTCVDLLE